MNKLSRLVEILKNPAYSLNPEHLCTNTWKSRRLSNLIRLEEILFNWNFRDITILEVGPGGIAEKYASKLPVFDEEDVEARKKNKKRLLNMFETIERNKSQSKLTCFEPLQIYEILSKRIGVKHMYVLDKYQRVLDGVERLNLPNLSTHLVDVSHPIVIPEISEVDLAIEFHVRRYCKHPEQVRDNISAKVRPLGIYSTTLTDTEQSNIQDYTLLKPNVYLKGSRPDKKTGWSKKADGLSENEIQRKINEVSQREGPYRVAL